MRPQRLHRPCFRPQELSCKPLTHFRKVFQGVATRYEMFQIFNRHSEAPFDNARHSGSIYAGEWFEITEADHDYMFEILPPLFVRGDLFAMREFQAGNVTSVFLALTIDEVCRWFHGYCDLSDKGSPERLRAAIIERESHPVRAMTREERLGAYLEQHTRRLSWLCGSAVYGFQTRAAHRAVLWRQAGHDAQTAQ